LFGANDPALYKLAMEVLRGEHAWLEQGIVSMSAQNPRRAASGAAIPSPAPPVRAVR
jgi:hypothetical protein